jgi:hypothetical protein
LPPPQENAAAGNLLVSDRNSASILKFTVGGTKTVFVSGGTRDENAGSERVHVNMNYSFLFRVNIHDTTAVPKESSSPTN